MVTELVFAFWVFYLFKSIKSKCHKIEERKIICICNIVYVYKEVRKNGKQSERWMFYQIYYPIFRLKKLDFSYVFSIDNNIAVIFYLSLSRDITLWCIQTFFYCDSIYYFSPLKWYLIYKDHKIFNESRYLCCDLSQIIGILYMIQT
jgi:hypothetical protein